MKNIRELTDEQAITIAKLATVNLVNWDWLMTLMRTNEKKDYNFVVTREVYDEKDNLLVVRVEETNTNTSCAIWEEDFNVDVYSKEGEEPTAEIVKIVKLLIEWDFV